VNAKKTAVIAPENRFHEKQLRQRAKNLADYFHRISPD
jgi:hypothetical protein